VARPRNQTERRSLLVNSALDAIRERGISSLRVRDVAEAAGVATGTVHYYFNDLDRLLHEVHSQACERFFGARIAALEGVDDARAKLARTIESGLPGSADDAIVIALYEIDVYKRGDPVHALLASALFDQQVALYYGILELGRSQGHFALTEPALDVARNLVALEDAYGMHIVVGVRSLPVAACRGLLAGYARTATGCKDIPVSAV
jgi:AcrR family transcriptional regulator